MKSSALFWIFTFLVHVNTSRMMEMNIQSYKRKMYQKLQNQRNSHKEEYPTVQEWYTPWSPWSMCRGGHRTRRRQCLQTQMCGGTLRVEISKCTDVKYEVRQNNETKTTFKAINSENVKNNTIVISKQTVNFKGYGAWSEWSQCSRKCTTFRKRFCKRTLVCGKQIQRQSAYCYLDGSYCHVWMKNKLRRKDQEYYIVHTAPITTTAPLINHKQERLIEPKCGVIGKYRGSIVTRRRAHMKEMLRIIGGRPAPPGKWPWQVAVLNKYKEAFCGGTLVSLRWAVTAAHCVRRKLYVRVGEHDLFMPDYGEMEMKITEMVVHPMYNPDTVVNDVAMLRLPFPARPDMGHGIACLPYPQQPLPPHTSCVILGWGKRRPTDIHGTRILNEAQVATIPQPICRRSYWEYSITDNMVCAGRGRRDSCAGDSGGPLLCRDRSRYYLQGITSFGDGCGKRDKYGIYTRTSGYVEWIQHVMDSQYED